MRIAHLILAHKNPEQLLRLVVALNHPAFDFYIHVDKKISDLPFKKLLQLPNVYFIENRTKVYWGDWGTIQATLNGFQIIIPKNYDYINILSAQDFPIKSPEYIFQYFSRHKGTEYITCDFIEGDWSDVESRISNYHLINFRIPGKHRLEKILTFLMPSRVFPLNYEIVGRANWFSLTNDAAKYVVDFLTTHPQLVRYFKFCWGADEFIFSTVLFNSVFKEKIRNNLMYVDWTSENVGHPKLLFTEDFDNLKSSEKLFARKFDIYIDAKILSCIEAHINTKPG